jgi:hypothetical protein
VPAEDGVRREAGTDLAEDLPTEDLAFDRQAPSLVVVEPDSPFAVGFLQHLVLGAKVLDHFLLLPVDQAGEDGQEEVPRLVIPANPIACSDGFRSAVPMIPIAHRSEATVNCG